MSHICHEHPCCVQWANSWFIFETLPCKYVYIYTYMWMALPLQLQVRFLFHQLTYSTWGLQSSASAPADKLQAVVEEHLPLVWWCCVADCKRASMLHSECQSQVGPQLAWQMLAFCLYKQPLFVFVGPGRYIQWYDIGHLRAKFRGDPFCNNSCVMKQMLSHASIYKIVRLFAALKCFDWNPGAERSHHGIDALACCSTQGSFCTVCKGFRRSAPASWSWGMC